MSENAEGQAQAPKDPKKAAKLLQIAFLILNVGVLGGGAYLTFASTIGYQPPQVSNEEVLAQLAKERGQQDSKPVMYTMDKFTANLDGFPTRVLQTQLNLEMLDEDGFEEVVNMGPQARDMVMRILNAKRFQDIETIQGKLFLKDQIRTALNSQLKRGVIKDVYFSEFVVQ